MCYDLLNLQVKIPTTTRQRKDLEFTQNQHNSGMEHTSHDMAIFQI